MKTFRLSNCLQTEVSSFCCKQDVHLTEVPQPRRTSPSHWLLPHIFPYTYFSIIP